VPGSLFGKCAKVHFVDDVSFANHAAPSVIGPSECVRVDHLRRAVRTLRLITRNGVGISHRIVVELETVERPRSCMRCKALVVAVGGGFERNRMRRTRPALQHNLHAPAFGRPYAKVCSACRARVRSHGQSARRFTDG
jgi:hypothetical protein